MGELRQREIEPCDVRNDKSRGRKHQAVDSYSGDQPDRKGSRLPARRNTIAVTAIKPSASKNASAVSLITSMGSARGCGRVRVPGGDGEHGHGDDAQAVNCLSPCFDEAPSGNETNDGRSEGAAAVIKTA